MDLISGGEQARVAHKMQTTLELGLGQIKPQTNKQTDPVSDDEQVRPGHKMQTTLELGLGRIKPQANK